MGRAFGAAQETGLWKFGLTNMSADFKPLYRIRSKDEKDTAAYESIREDDRLAHARRSASPMFLGNLLKLATPAIVAPPRIRKAESVVGCLIPKTMPPSSEEVGLLSWYPGELLCKGCVRAGGGM